MTNPFKVLAISLIPNFLIDDVALSLKLLLSPWNYSNHKWEEELKISLQKYLDRKYVFLFDSGRTAEYFLLKSMGISRGDEVIIQAFTCVAVPNSIIWLGAKPVYVDIDDTLNIDVAKLECAIISRTKAVIVQHTFGTPANIERIKEICRKKGIKLIEDAAHGFGNIYKGEKIGTWGEAAFFSFGRDKVISGIWGGAVATDNDAIARSMDELLQKVPHRGSFWVARQLVYPGIVYLVINTYGFLGMGKLIHKLALSCGILPRVLTREEKNAVAPNKFYQGLPGALAAMILNQYVKLSLIIEHRRQLARNYARLLGTKFDDISSYLRYSIFVDEPNKLREFAAKRNIFLGDWYDGVVAPKGVDLEGVGYVAGSCPKAEEYTRKIVNLPTSPNLTMDDVQRVVSLVKIWKLKK